MKFLRKHRESLLTGLAVLGICLIVNSDRLFSDERPLHWSKEYPLTGMQTDLDAKLNQIRSDAFNAMRGSWSGAKERPVKIIKVELRGER